MILLDERQEVLMLVTNSLKNDLCNRRNPFTVGLALAALGNICSAEMARDLAPDVLRLLQDHANPYVRKKAALCAVRVLKKNPELAEDFAAPAAELLADARHHGVVLSGATLMMAICALDPSGALPAYRAMVPAICRLLKGVLQGNSVGGGDAGGGGGGGRGGASTTTYLSAAEHDVGGINDPFLQVRLLQLLRVLGKGDAAASDAMADVLAQAVAASSPGGGGAEGDAAAASNAAAAAAARSSNAANAVLYEAVNTIVGVESVSGLRAMAVNALGRFLAQRGDDNMRFVALGVLCRVVSGAASPADGAALVQRHRATVVDCVRDGDPSIRKRALELACALATPQNVRPLARELIDYLSVCEADFRADLAARVAELAQRHAPDRRWHVDALLSVLERAGGHVREEAVRGFAVLVANSPPELQAYAARGVVRALRAAGVGAGAPPGGARGGGSAAGTAPAAAAFTPSAAEPALLTAALWVLGEYGDTLVAPALASSLLEGEPPFSPPLTEAGVVSLIEAAAALMMTPAQLRRAAAQAPMSVHSVAAKRLAAARGRDQGAVLVDATFSASSGAAAAGAGAAAGGSSALLPPRVAEYALTALAKLAARLPSQAQRCASLLARHRASAPLEVQARACEFGALLKEGGIVAAAGGGGDDGGGSLVAVDDALSVLALDTAAPAGDLLAAVLERMPAVDEAEYLRSHLGAEAAAAAAGRAAAGPGGGEGAAAAAGGGDLADLLGPGLAAAGDGAAAAAGPSAAAAPGSAAAIGLDDLLGGIGGGGAKAAPAAAAAAAAAAVGGGGGGAGALLLDDLLGGGGGAPAAPSSSAPTTTTTTFPPVVAFDKDGLKVTLAFSKAPSAGGGAAATVVVLATATNADPSRPVTSLALQAAVPKYLQLRLEPASGTSLPPAGAAAAASVTQRMHVTNSAQGQKPLALRLRVVYARGGVDGGAAAAPVTEVVELGADRLPAGL
jgi:AP-1 complex subunit gamma-1